MDVFPSQKMGIPFASVALQTCIFLYFLLNEHLEEISPKIFSSIYINAFIISPESN
jgi:hypothetical protein